MKNEIVRKLTSLTLITIMFAGGLTFAFPGVMPQASAAHNANLFVSAESTTSSNIFTGPMVIEVVISDSSIASLDDGHGEPSVTVNGDKVRMLQATDGNWYAYIADVDMAKAADATQPGLRSGQDNSTAPGKGLNFGKFCSNTSGNLLGFAITETEGVAIPANATGGRSNTALSTTNGTDGTAAFVACTATEFSAYVSSFRKEMNVVRENKTLTRATTGVLVGQLGIRDANFWPFIQLFDFTPTGTAVVKYTKGGSTQTTTLTFDSMTGISLSTDRSLYPVDAAVHVTLTDFQLNIDPTDEDSWTWGGNVGDSVSNSTVFYQLFNQTGNRDADGVSFQIINWTRGTVPLPQIAKNTQHALGAQNLAGNITSGTFMHEDNGILTLNNNTQGTGIDIIELEDNTDSELFRQPNQDVKGLRTNTIAHNNLPITLTETSPNSGIFTSTDEADKSVLNINSACTSSTGLNTCRGRSATIAYDDVSYSILVGTSFATLSMDETSLGGEWNSGETIDVTLVDNDANLNSRVDEDLDVFNNATKLIPAISIGSPFTIKSGDNATVWDSLKIGTTQTSGSGFLTTTSGVLNYWAAGSSVDTFSQRMIFTPSFPSGVNQTFVDLDIRTGRFEMPAITVDSGGRTLSDLKNVVKDPRGGTVGKFKGLNMINVDFRSFDQNVDDISTGKGFNATRIFVIGKADGTDLTFADIRARNGASVFAFSVANTTIFKGLINLNATDSANSGCSGCNVYRNLFDLTTLSDDDQIGLLIHFDTNDLGFPSLGTATRPFVVDFFSFGFTNDGDATTDRVNNAIYRLELEETGDNTSTFIGTAEYVMLNQINILQTSTYTSLATVSDDVTIIVHEDLTDEDAVRVNYNDLAGDGTILPTADQQAAPTHSGVVSFDFDNYKIADTVTVTLTDQDLNVDSEVIDIFTVVTNSTVTTTVADIAYDQVGAADYGQNSRGDNFGRLLDITFDDERWLAKGISSTTCAGTLTAPSDDGLAATGFTLVETGIASGVFTGTFAIPAQYCARASGTGTLTSVTGTDLEVNYVDYRDASGEIIEVGDGAGVRANTGSVSLDRTVYPVPWGTISDATAASSSTATLPTGKTPTTGTTTRSLFPIHATGISGGANAADETLASGDVVVHIRVNDPDFNPSGTGSDTIAQNATSASSGADLKHGPVKIMVQRGTDIALLATAGGAVVNSGVITNGADVITSGGTSARTREIGPITEVSPDAGIFELDFTVRYTDGPLSSKCPTGTARYTALDGSGINQEQHRFFSVVGTGGATTGQFAQNSTTAGRHCILQGDIITVEYRDPTDASGNINTVTDSATFDLRNGVLQSDKSVYIIGSDMILTLIEPDFDRDNDTAETYDLDLIEWDSDAAELTMGNKASIAVAAETGAAFDPEPSNFRETGDSTGIFQIVIEIPSVIGGTTGKKLDRGEAIELEYTDWGPSGADFVGEEDQDINLKIFTSNFGATVELDQKVYTWTDKVFITIVAPDHNFDSNLVDEIGETADDQIIVQTRQAKLTQYKLVETGTDTGIFTGEVILAGFIHDADGNPSTGDSSGNDITASNTQTGSGPTDGKLSSTDNDGLTVSFEFNEDETVIGSALIRWNIGEVSWLEASYPATGTGVVRIVDPDMNLNPESVDNFNVDVWSDSDAGGIDLTVTETNEATGIYEGTVFFTITDESSGHRLRVAEGDTITAEYEDNTLPDPYTRADELEITGTAIIGTIVPPLERAPAANARVVDAFGNSLTSVSVDQQVQIAADLSNGQDRDQKFAYLVQIQDESGVTVSLAWITGSLTAGQSFSPALSWIPDAAGTYTATVFVWESVDNPTALSPTVTTTINVS